MPQARTQLAFVLVLLWVATGAVWAQDPTLVTIDVNPHTASIPNGIRQQFSAVEIRSDGSTMDVSSLVNWTAVTADTGSADIDAHGLATATGVGDVVITATHAESGLSDSATLTVTPAVLTSLTVTPTNSSIPVGLSVQFFVTGSFDDSTAYLLLNLATWSTGAPGDTGTASIDAVTGFATALSEGTVTVQASYSGLTATAILNVTSAVVIAIDVSPREASVPLGGTQQYTATGFFTDGTTGDLTDAVQWAAGGGSGDATISATGLATTHAVGVVTIVARYQGGPSDTATLTILPGVLPIRIDIKPGSDVNCINAGSSGVIPVALLGDFWFDVDCVDPGSLSLAGLGVHVRPNGEPACAVEDVNGDGIDDLVCHFVNDDAATWSPGSGTAMLTGRLLDGTPFAGTDSIRVIR